MIQPMNIFKGIFAIMVGFLSFQANIAFAQTTPSADVIEEVVVYSIRKSLESALAEKRNKNNLTEVINADDIGKLPDENVAEVLENIPGVQITRSAGIGQTVSIRGSDQNRVEINGRGTTSSGDDRGGMSFSDLPASLVRSLNVVKVPTADMVEGSIGGTINVKTYRGLKLKKPLKVARYSSEYAENSDEWNDNFALTLGKKYETEFGDIGGMLTLSYIDKTVREDALRVSVGTRKANQSTIDFDDDGANDPYYIPAFGDLSYGLQDRENKSFTGSLEWQVNPGFKLFAEGSYTDHTKLGRTQSAFLGIAGGGQELDFLDDATFGYVTIADTPVGQMTSGKINAGENDGLQLRMNNRSNTRNTDTFLAAFGGEWDVDDWLYEFEVSSAGADTEDFALTTIFQFNDPTNNNFHSVGARLRVPFIYDIRGGDLSYGPIDNASYVNQLLDPDYYSLYKVKDADTTYKNREDTQKLDVTKYLDHSIFTTIKFGFRASQRSNERSKTSEQVDWPGLSGADLESFLISTPGDFFEFNGDGVYLDNFLTADAYQVNSRRTELRGLVGLDINGVIDPLQGFSVEEETEAFYFRADFETYVFNLNIKGNVGIRQVNTDQLAAGNEVSQAGELTYILEEQKYTHWLPSASLVFLPVDKLQVRLGYAEILRRPNFSQLSPTVQFPLNSAQSVNVGDPSLQPTTAKQYDLSLEYYFRKGSVVSFGYFYKDLDSVIGTELRYNAICNTQISVQDQEDIPCQNGDLNGVLVNRNSPVNLPGGKIQGVEIAFQHNFNHLPRPFDGLGVIANYAYQDGDRDKSFGVPAFLQGQVDDPNAEFPLNFVRLSENSYNLTLYFERPRYRWSGRLRYTYRDGYLFSESDELAFGQPVYSDDRGQLNASMSYRIDKTFAITFSGVNLTKEQGIRRAAYEDGPIVQQKDADRRFALGIRAKF